MDIQSGIQCQNDTIERPIPRQSSAAAISPETIQILKQIISQYGTPTYAYDLRTIECQAVKLREHLPSAVEILYSLKANASLGLSAALANQGLGADVASAGELVTALSAGFSPAHIFLTGPDKSPPVLEQLRLHPDIVVSLDSVSEMRLCAEAGLRNRVLLRLRPDFCSYATCSAGPDSRFGLTVDDFAACRSLLSSIEINLVGFHVFSGSQVLQAEGVNHHLRNGLDLALRGADVIGIQPEIIDIGGGFGIPYGVDESELNLAEVGNELQALVKRAQPARLVIELGRYLIAQAGWYLTTVLAEQTHHGRKAVVVDGGSHQRVDMCGVGLSHKVVPYVLSGDPSVTQIPTDVLGCLSLPADILVESGLLPPVTVGEQLAFATAGAYGLHAAPCLFHSHPPPAEVAFDGTRLYPLRKRQSIQSVLDGQSTVEL